MALVPWLPTPRARWVTGRSDSWAARGVSQGQPSGATLFSSTSPLSHVCQGWREDQAVSLLVCMIGVVCISFLVLGLMIAVLLPGAGSPWSSPVLGHLVPHPAAAGCPALAVGWASTGGSRVRAQGADACLDRWGVDMWHIEIYIL